MCTSWISGLKFVNVLGRPLVRSASHCVGKITRAQARGLCGHYWVWKCARVPRHLSCSSDFEEVIKAREGVNAYTPDLDHPNTWLSADRAAQTQKQNAP